MTLYPQLFARNGRTLRPFLAIDQRSAGSRLDNRSECRYPPERPMAQEASPRAALVAAFLLLGCLDRKSGGIDASSDDSSFVTPIVDTLGADAQVADIPALSPDATPDSPMGPAGIRDASNDFDPGTGGNSGGAVGSGGVTGTGGVTYTGTLAGTGGVVGTGGSLGFGGGARSTGGGAGSAGAGGTSGTGVGGGSGLTGTGGTSNSGSGGSSAVPICSFDTSRFDTCTFGP